MLRLAITFALLTGFAPPAWLHASEHRFLVGFGSPTPRRVHYIAYPKKIAVIFEFDRVVICGLCSAPSNASLPRGRVVRVAFERRPPHHGGGVIRFCETRGRRPPLADCLRR